MTELLEGLPGVVCYLDDIIVIRRTLAEHDSNLCKVLEAIEKSGLKLNKDKCVFRQKEIEFLGHIISDNGVKISPEKVKAILELPQPTNVPELRCILGMVNFLARFLPRLQSVVQPLNLLLSKQNAWVWDQDQEAAFKSMKKILTSAPVLSYFDARRPTKVSADASSFGIGGVVLQKYDSCWRPVAFCPRTLSINKQKWGQVEKECLAAVWACERFHQFLIGIPFILQTDHKPLIPLLNCKELHAAPLRCQRLLMRLARFSLTAEYTSGKFMVVADTLSRAPISCGEEAVEGINLEVEDFIGGIICNLPVSRNQLQRIKEEQLKDSNLRQVIMHVLQG